MSAALRSLSDHKLLSNTRALVVREREITLNVLHHLNEIERRKLHLKQGHASMFAYCTAGLGYSASAAKRRICTARCIAHFPAAIPLLERNEVNLSTITQVSRVMKPDNAAAVLKRIRGKSQREVEAIVAEFEPLAALPPDRARTVVVRVPVGSIADLNNNSAVPAVCATAPAAPERAGETEQNENTRLTDQVRNGPAANAVELPQTQFQRRTVVQFTAREEVLAKLEEVRLLASHRMPANAPLEDVIEFLADYFTQREDPKARSARREAKKDGARPAKQPKASSPRTIPARVRDEIFVRDQGQCGYVGSNGKRCESRHVLQIDHIQPVARGGAGTAENLRLLCAHHNRLEAERLLGRSGP